MVIAHRLSTIRRANRIAVIEEGRITAIGSHDDLLNTSPTYQRLYQLQFMDQPERADRRTCRAFDSLPARLRAGLCNPDTGVSKNGNLFDDRICAGTGARPIE